LGEIKKRGNYLLKMSQDKFVEPGSE
jgi:hypothetical protein